ncbi:MAG TPA: hypothetical protein VF508_02565, partial [Pyrinomonadaceae bacterium]
MKHALRLSRAAAALAAVAALVFWAAAARPALAQTPSATPDTAIFQITVSNVAAQPTPTATPSATPTPTPTPTPVPRDSFAGDISGNGRFVVIESTGDIATERTAARNNADGNVEIFLFDYAQRRIFQITNTKSVLKDATKPTYDATNIDIQVVNLQPTISRDGKYIVFVSNAYNNGDASQTPKNFVGADNAAALRLDGNTEVFIYAVPDVPEVDLTQGTEVAPVDLTTGPIAQLTRTAASSTPRPAANNGPAFFARDNDAPVVNDNGALVAFYSLAKSGNLGTGNTDGNKEIFVARVTRDGSAFAASFAQVTNTQDVAIPNSLLKRQIYNMNPSLSACNGTLPCRVAFLSNAALVAGESEANQGNGEVYVADISTADGTASNLRQVTKTPRETRASIEEFPVNLLSPGRRISRDAAHIAFESTAVFNENGTLNGALSDTTGIYIANIPSSGDATFNQVSVRPPSDQSDLGLRWPTFTGDSTRVVWASILNLRADGTVSTTTGEGLNQQRRSQVFSAPLNALTTVMRVTN